MLVGSAATGMVPSVNENKPEGIRKFSIQEIKYDGPQIMNTKRVHARQFGGEAIVTGRLKGAVWS
jgi:hypothetical protein